MRTLALLAAALLLLAVQAQAKALRETDDQVPAQDLPEALDQDQLEAEEQNQPGAEGQDVAISFGGANHLVQDASGLHRAKYCRCRRNPCRYPHFSTGTCMVDGTQYYFCCR